jgi:hypothetical protein
VASSADNFNQKILAGESHPHRRGTRNRKRNEMKGEGGKIRGREDGG